MVAAALARTLAGEGRRVAVFKPCVTGLDEGGENDHELLRRAAHEVGDAARAIGLLKAPTIAA